MEPCAPENLSEVLSCIANIKNTGATKGDEVMQVYIEYPNKSSGLPLKELRQFKRVAINKGSAQAVMINIPLTQLKKWDEKTQQMSVPKGTYRLFVGGHSDDKKLASTFTVL
jgi:beta-glucosidase